MDRKPALARWQGRALAAIPLLCTVLVAIATLAVLAHATANARHRAGLAAWATAGAGDLGPVVAVVLLGALANVIALLLCVRARTRGVASEAVALERLDRQRGQLEQQVAEIESMDEALVERTELAERERELAEAARRRTDEILESISDAFFAVDDDWCVQYVNTQAEALFCARRHEIVGRSVWQAFPRLPGTALERALHRAARERELVRFEEYYRGGFYAVAVYPSASGLSVFLHDVTETRAAEARFRAIAEAMPHMVFSAGRDGHFDYCNERFLAYTGHPRDFAGDGGWAFVHPEDAPAAKAAWQEALAVGQPMELRVRLANAADGSYRWFLVRAVPVRGRDGAAIRWVGTCTDVHEYHSRSTLVHGLYEFALALSGADTVEQVAGVACDWGRRVLGADHALVALLTADGQALAPVAGIGVGERFLAEATIPLDAPGAICAAARTGAVLWAGSAEERERVFPLTLGMSLEGVAGAPLRLEGRTLGAWSLGYDRPGTLTGEEIQLLEAVTAQCAQAIERARLHDSERSARAEAEQANAAKSKFLSIMSHDLRTPLNSILGYTELLQGGFIGALEPKQADYLARIRASTEMLRTQIEEILEFAGIEAGRTRIRSTDVAVPTVLDRVVAMLEPLARARDIALVRAPGGLELAVWADEHRVVQILMNLVNNAAKFTPAGGTIRLAAMADDQSVHIAVADDGAGIPAGALDSIFEPFVQADRPPEHGTGDGVGLGLAISRELARAMGGDVVARAGVPTGSVFTLILPRGQAQPGRNATRRIA